MEFMSKPGELLKLEDDRVFLVVKNLEHDGVPYLYLFQPPEDPNAFFDGDGKKTMFAKEVNEDGKTFVEEVLDKKVLSALKRMVKNTTVL